MQDQPGGINPKTRSIVYTLFFLSGAAGLIYEVVWSRMLTVILGATTYAASTVLAAFMGGMALGNFAIGRLADRYGNRLLVYAALEGGIGIFALLVPTFLRGTDDIYVIAYRSFQNIPYTLIPIRFLLALAILLVPTALMGGTLPIIVKFFASSLEKVGRSIGVLYGLNTFGAVSGVLLAGFLLIEAIGVREAGYFAVALNLLISAVAFVLSRKIRPPEVASPPPTEEAKVPPSEGEAGLALGIAAISGFCALAYEILWTRTLIHILGNSVYSFTIMLATVLLGLALGGFIASRFADGAKDLLFSLGALQVGIGIAATFSLILMVRGISSVSAWMIGAEATWWKFSTARFLGASLVMAIPAILMGAVLPIASKIYAPNLRELGGSVGRIYGSNTLGALLGSLAAGFAIIPFLGIGGGIASIALVNAALGMSVAILHGKMRPRKRWILSAAVALAIVSTFLIPREVIRDITQKGMGPDWQAVYHREDVGSTITVLKNIGGENWKTLSINGTNEVLTSFPHMQTFRMLGHLPLLIHPSPKRVLVIALGAGITLSSVATHPEIKIDNVEIVPRLVESAKYFEGENHKVLENPDIDLNVIIDDARNYLLATDKKYDVITLDATHPWSADSWVLYTKEAYELMRKSLDEGGIVAQWLPLHRLDGRDYRSIIKTFTAVFPHTTLWVVGDSHTLILGASESIKIDFPALSNKMKISRVGEDLASVGLGDPYSLLGRFVMGSEGMEAFVEGAYINTDDHPRIQFKGPRNSYRRVEETVIDNLSDLGRARESVRPLLTGLPDDAGENIERQYEVMGKIIDAILKIKRAKYREALPVLQEALKLSPGDRTAKHFLKYLYLDLAMVESGLRQHAKAVEDARAALEIDPSLAVAHYILAASYGNQGRFREAESEALEAMKLAPDYVRARYILALLYLRAGRADDARAELREILRISPEFGRALVKQFE
ncbi:MAG: fused MFS/spermidine synthase [bacterium]